MAMLSAEVLPSLRRVEHLNGFKWQTAYMSKYEDPQEKLDSLVQVTMTELQDKGVESGQQVVSNEASA